jgi:transcriptional antiterminator RfaH
MCQTQRTRDGGACSMLAWYVVRAKYRQESTARDSLGEKGLGFEVFLPVGLVEVFSRRNNRKKEWVLRPLFPPYLFVAFDTEVDQWRDINGARGVDHLLCDGEIPIRIPAKEFEAATAVSADESQPAKPKRLPEIKPGLQFRITDGPLTSFDGVVDALSDSDQVKLLVNLLGRMVPVTLSRSQIEEAA